SNLRIPSQQFAVISSRARIHSHDLACTFNDGLRRAIDSQARESQILSLRIGHVNASFTIYQSSEPSKFKLGYTGIETHE
ncbi:MAG: hypothetical protein ABSA72_10380, partial [Nitrososphaerales archaeon]